MGAVARGRGCSDMTRGAGIGAGIGAGMGAGISRADGGEKGGDIASLELRKIAQNGINKKNMEQVKERKKDRQKEREKDIIEISPKG